MRVAGSVLALFTVACTSHPPAAPPTEAVAKRAPVVPSRVRPEQSLRSVAPRPRDVAARLAGLTRRAKERPSPEYAPQYWMCAAPELVLRLPDPAWRFGPDPTAARETARSAPAFDALRRQVERGDWDRVVERLDALLDDEDPFVRLEARRRLCALPPPGRAVYEDFHRDRAWALLQRGAADADPEPLEELLARHPASEAATRARELLLERRIERGELAAALALIDDPAGWPTSSPEAAAALANTRTWVAARVGVAPIAAPGSITISLASDAARVAVTISRIEPGLDERETVRVLGAEEEARLIASGAPLVRRERPVVGRPSWLADVQGPVPSTHAVVYRARDGALFRFTSTGSSFDLEAWLRRSARM